MDRTYRSRMLRLVGLALIASFAGCATMGVKDGKDSKPLIPSAFQVRTGPYVIYTSQKLEANAPVVRQLQSLEAQVNETLGVRVDPGTNPVEVYILDDRKSFDHFLTFYYPELPHRRAFFLANGSQRVVYTFFGDRLEEDIRKGINAEHLGRLPEDLQKGWIPDLPRLESLRAVKQMTPRDYRESWAWVHYLLNTGKAEKTALLSYLADIKITPDARTISARLDKPAPEPLLAHLKKIQENPVAVDAPRDSTVRFQNGLIESPVLPTKRKGFFGKIRDLFGS
jgi:hypothetical protein